MQWYDATHNRLVYGGEAATPHFWATTWQTQRSLQEVLQANTTDPLIPRLTRRFIAPSPEVKILDGGCGLGQHVARLTREGYDAYGIDNDQETVQKINEVVPQLKITYGDVRSLPYADAFFDGYWSVGVIEHWTEGYEACAREMYRVLKPGGYLFLTFPHMSPLRHLKVRWHMYPTAERLTEQFYQFALDSQRVVADFQQRGFRLVLQKQTNGLKGLKDEASLLRRPLQRLYNSRWLPARLTKVGLSTLLTPLTGHSAVLVLQKHGKA